MSVTALAILAAALGVSFTADTGTATFTVTSGGGTVNHVYIPTYGASTSGIPAAVAAGPWKYGTASGVNAKAPSWSPVANAAGAVTGAGDIALIDATDTSTASINVHVYVTNMAKLGNNYGSFAWPVEVYSASGVASNAITWNSSVFGSTQFLTDTGGSLSWSLPTGASKWYEVVLDTGGSFFTTSTDTTTRSVCTSGVGCSLAPDFYVTAQATN